MFPWLPLGSIVVFPVAVSSAGAYTATSVVTPTFCQMSVAMSNHHTRPVGHFSHDAHIAMRPGELPRQRGCYGNMVIFVLKLNKYFGALVF